MTNEIELGLTIAVLILVIALAVFCYYKAMQPPNPLKPRMVSYPLIMLVLALLFLATLAHAVSLITGKQVQPRRRRGM